MESDERLYEMAAEEFEKNPRQGLLIKSVTNSDGDEKKGKALYIKTRVSEMKIEIMGETKNQEQEIEEKIGLSGDLSYLCASCCSGNYFQYLFLLVWLVLRKTLITSSRLIPII